MRSRALETSAAQLRAMQGGVYGLFRIAPVQSSHVVHRAYEESKERRRNQNHSQCINLRLHAIILRQTRAAQRSTTRAGYVNGAGRNRTGFGMPSCTGVLRRVERPVASLFLSVSPSTPPHQAPVSPGCHVALATALRPRDFDYQLSVRAFHGVADIPSAARGSP